MNQLNFLVRHYDDTITMHGTLKAAMKEATQRLEPWRDSTDKVARQSAQQDGADVHRVLVINSVNEPTDAESIISPCGDWIDARECLPKANQRVLACWLEENEPANVTEFSITDSQFISWAMKYAHKPTRAWWRPMPALPDECKGAAEC